jgi:D-sedoheptulose 7-phosphate isomerase
MSSSVTDQLSHPATDADDHAVATARSFIGAAHESVGRLRGEAPRLARWAGLIKKCLEAGGTVLTAGNGGSAAHAAHLAGELSGRFLLERPPLRAVCLASDGPTVTAIANDYGYAEVFARQVRAIARPGDVVVLFSTSGRSPNVALAAQAGRACGAVTLAFTGPGTNPLGELTDDAIAPVATNTASIQDAHHVALHALCAALDDLLGLRMPEVTP